LNAGCLYALILLLATVAATHAQIAVDLSLKRRYYLRHEPIVATVTLTNQSGRELTLEDTPTLQWFGFQINGEGDSIVPPRNPDYGLDPVVIQAGETVRKSVNLNELYELGDLGTYKVRATIYLAPSRRYIVSRPRQIDLTEGRVLMQQTAGVPEGQTRAGAMHRFTLLTHFVEDARTLYARIDDRDDARVFGTYPLGRLADGAPVQAEFDTGSNLYVLHYTGQRSWVLSKIGVNGEFLGQTLYDSTKSRPSLRRLADGTLQIVGGRKEAPIAQTPTEPPVKLSDRPPGLPR
jgi:hypothetical protein